MTEAQVRERLRAWVTAQSGVVVDDRTPLLSSRLVTSLQITDLLLLVEELLEQPLDPATLKPGVFRDVDTIYATFFGEPAP